eukprot:c19439_g1_i3 orf=498-2318(+)
MEDRTEEFRPSQDKNKDSSSKKINISPGDLMKAIIRPGEGDTRPQQGDQIVFHYTTRTTDGVIVESTKSEYGGKGAPCRLVLGKSKMIKGWEESIPTMLKGEVSMLKVKPALHYGDEECPVAVPEGFPTMDELMFEIELNDFFKVKVVADDLGVVKRVLKEGEGWETAREPYEVKVWLTVRTSKGILFSSSKEKEPFHFTFGKQEVPAGLELGVGTMTRKEKSIIYASHQYIVPSFSVLGLPLDSEEVEFEVEVIQIIQVRDMVGNGQLIKRRIHDGQGEFPMDCPLQDSRLCIHYKGILPDDGGKVFYDTRRDHNGGQPLVFGSGEGLVPEGLEMCIKLMLPGEVACVTSAPEYAYDKFPRPESVPEGATVQWEVELLNFEKAKDWTGLTFQEIMEEVDIIKATGNRLFKEGKYDLAKTKYEKVLRDFNHVNPQDDEEGKTFAQARSQLHLNVAACFQKMGECIKSIESCNKALYRRGMAYMATGDFDEARVDFQMMITVDKATEPDANAALMKLKRKEQEAEAKARKQFKGLFDKKPGELSNLEDRGMEKAPADATEEPLLRDCPDQSNDNISSKKGSLGHMSKIMYLWKRLQRTSISQRCAIL